MKKFLPDLIAILAFIILSFAYFFPADIEGRILFQHDTAAGVGAGQESKEYLFTNASKGIDMDPSAQARNSVSHAGSVPAKRTAQIGRAHV